LLGRHARVAWVCLGLVLVLVLVASSARSQEADELADEFAILEEEIKPDEVESASKHRQSIFWSPAAITVFTREQIMTSGATNLADLLRRVPGFDVYEMKPSFPLVGARALTDHSNNLVLVLVDGREALVELAGFCIWAAMTIDIEEIERIEVIRGPGSTLYGANAFAAVVNITTMSEQPRRLAANAYITAGQQGRWRLFGRSGGAWPLAGGVLSFSASLGTGGTRSFSDRTDQILRSRERFHSFVRYQRGQDLDLSLHGGLLDGDGPLYMIVGDFQARPVLNHYVMARATFGLTEDLKLKAQLYHIRYRGNFHYRSHFYAYGTWISDIPDFVMDTHTFDGQLQLDWRVAEWLHLVSGANLRYSYMESNKVIGGSNDELRGAVFANSEWRPLDSLQVTGGFRLDLNSETEPAFSPRLAAVWRPWTDQAFRLGYGLAFRKPSFVEGQLHLQVDNYNPAMPEIVDKLRDSVGNEDLKNEKVHSLEAGWRGHFLDSRVTAALDLFYNFYLDTVSFVSVMALGPMGAPDITNSTFRYENNTTRTEACGGEVEVSVALSAGTRLWGNLGLRRVTYSSGERLPSEPVLRANLGGSYTPVRGLVIDLALHYVSSYTVTLLAMTNPFEESLEFEQNLGNRWLLIGRLGYRTSWYDQVHLETGLTIRTPLGAPFREYAGLPVPEPDQTTVSASDWAGEKLARLVTFYLRASF